MLRDAIEKLKQEMANEKNPYIQYVGDYLIGYLKNHEDQVEKILAEKKTIAGSMKFMRTVASKKKQGNVAVLTPEEGFKAVLEYFEIDEKIQLRVVDDNKKVDISLDELF